MLVRMNRAMLAQVTGPAEFAAAFDVSRETIDRLATYERLLRQWQAAVNLVAPSTLDAVWHRHFADSAQLLALAPSARTWVDLGAGAGFPGLVIAILLADAAGGGEVQQYGVRPYGPPLTGYNVADAGSDPIAVSTPHLPIPEETWGERTRARITLIDSNARKCAFLREVVRQTGIGKPAQPGVVVDILSTRIETAATQASLQGPDVVSARALAPLDKLLGLAAPLFAPSTVGLFLKGRDAAMELDAARNAWTFTSELVQSCTQHEACIVVVRDLEP